MFLACFRAAKCGSARTSRGAQVALCERAMRLPLAVIGVLAISTALGCARAADPPPEYPPLDATPPALVPDPVLPVAPEAQAPGVPPAAIDAPAPTPGSAPPSSAPQPESRAKPGACCAEVARSRV